MNYITKIAIKNFTCFDNESVTFDKGINVIIGKNGVGKTHLLKLLYSHLHAMESYTDLSTEIEEKLLDSYFIEYITPLKRNHKDFEIKVNFGDLLIESKSNKSNKISAKINQSSESKRNVIYIPPSDIMTNYEIYSQFSEINKLNLDSTYYYLAQALKKEMLDEPELSEISHLIKCWLEVDILKDENGFYQLQNQNKIYAPLMADGIKKIATLKYLIDNNSITSKTILFIDEPEVHLNPILISKYVELVIALAENGVQIILSSHDYLFTYLLSLHAEYKKDSDCTIKYFSLVESNDGTKIDSGNVIADLKTNSIVEEYDKLLEVEHSYFFKE